MIDQPTSMPGTAIITPKGSSYLFPFQDDYLYMSRFNEDSILFFCVIDSSQLHEFFAKEIERKAKLIE